MPPKNKGNKKKKQPKTGDPGMAAMRSLGAPTSHYAKNSALHNAVVSTLTSITLVVVLIFLVWEYIITGPPVASDYYTFIPLYFFLLIYVGSKVNDYFKDYHSTEATKGDKVLSFWYMFLSFVFATGIVLWVEVRRDDTKDKRYAVVGLLSAWVFFMLVDPMNMIKMKDCNARRLEKHKDFDNKPKSCEWMYDETITSGASYGDMLVFWLLFVGGVLTQGAFIGWEYIDDADTGFTPHVFAAPIYSSLGLVILCTLADIVYWSGHCRGSKASERRWSFVFALWIEVIFGFGIVFWSENRRVESQTTRIISVIFFGIFALLQFIGKQIGTHRKNSKLTYDQLSQNDGV